MENSITLKIKTKIKLEKYPSGYTKEQIKNGEVKPIEVVEIEDGFNKENK